MEKFLNPGAVALYAVLGITLIAGSAAAYVNRQPPVRQMYMQDYNVCKDPYMAIMVKAFNATTNCYDGQLVLK